MKLNKNIQIIIIGCIVIVDVYILINIWWIADPLKYIKVMYALGALGVLLICYIALIIFDKS
jgi:hypothetical protein